MHSNSILSANGVPPTLLVVEDDLDQREILEMVLKSAGYNVKCAAHGGEALEIVARGAPQVIITDLMMPLIDGAELVNRIRANPTTKHIPILILTVIADSESEFKLLELGADDYCEKTTQRKILLKRIEKLIARSANRTGDTPQ